MSLKSFFINLGVDAKFLTSTPSTRNKLISEIKPNQQQNIKFLIPKKLNNKEEFFNSYVNMIMGLFKFYIGERKIWVVITKDVQIKNNVIVGEFL
jgi:hypothetical protein